jgi:hypothetical protein
MGGYNLECAADCDVTMPLPKPNIEKFDEFGDIARNDEKARLDNFAIALQQDPTSTGYVIVYPGPNSKRAEVQDHFGRVIDYLVNSRQIDKSRIRTIEGPRKDQIRKQLWVAPQGAAPPNP